MSLFSFSFVICLEKSKRLITLNERRRELFVDAPLEFLEIRKLCSSSIECSNHILLFEIILCLRSHAQLIFCFLWKDFAFSLLAVIIYFDCKPNFRNWPCKFNEEKSMSIVQGSSTYDRTSSHLVTVKRWNCKHYRRTNSLQLIKFTQCSSH